MSIQNYDVCVIGGCGHVGLPLSIALANKGKRVCVFDIDEKASRMVQNGEMPFFEEGAEPILKNVIAQGTFSVSLDPSVISNSDVLVLIIGTPVDEHLNPKFSLMRKIITQYLPYFKEDQLIILRSTVYPGITKKIDNWLKDEGKKVHLAFCPERIAEGFAMKELSELPQIVSSFSEEGVKRSSELFGHLTEDIVVMEPMEAELTKLFNNVWRYIKFATANQFYMLANDYGLDFYKIYHGMTHNYKRAQDFPKPGFAAGPCLFKDAMQLAAFNNNNFYLGHAAMLVNEGLPNYIVKKLREKYDLDKLTVGILGMAFKKDIDDKRESLSYKLKKILEVECRKVYCSDPYIQDPDFIEPLDLINTCDIIVLATPHSVYSDLNVSDKKVVDVWNFWDKGAIV